MKVKTRQSLTMEVKTIVSLTSQEKEALWILCNISCSDIDSCSDCPFKDKQSPACLLSHIQRNAETVLKQLKGGENNVNGRMVDEVHRR